jgi:hypothetical protein
VTETSDKTQGPAPVDTLIEGLRRDGDVDSEGEFTLDRAQARKKMTAYRDDAFDVEGVGEARTIRQITLTFGHPLKYEGVSWGVKR